MQIVELQCNSAIQGQNFKDWLVIGGTLEMKQLLSDKLLTRLFLLREVEASELVVYSTILPRIVPSLANTCNGSIWITCALHNLAKSLSNLTKNNSKFHKCMEQKHWTFGYNEWVDGDALMPLKINIWWFKVATKKTIYIAQL